MANNKFEKINILGYETVKRVSDGYINSTIIQAEYNKKNNSNKSVKDFWTNSSTWHIYRHICLSNSVDSLHCSIRGKYGATWMHELFLPTFINWLHKIPNNTITRDEFIFCDYIIESFNGILVFEKQKVLGSYVVDLYCESLKICIEFDEEYHNSRANIDKDLKRQYFLESNFGVKFIRHNEKDNYSLTINKILKLWRLTI